MCDFKQAVQDQVENISEELIALSDYIWKNPEYGFKEYKACKAMTDILRKHGFEVVNGEGGIETSVKAVYDSQKPGPNIGIIGEFDAFPGMGHSCGHNLICAMSVGAGIAVRSVIDQIGGKITVIGAPAEEGGGGKVIMLENGAFDGIDAAMLIHGGDETVAGDISYSRTDLRVHYYGKKAHAATWPEEGVSALHPVLNLFQVIANMRLELADSGKILGIISHGGDQPIFIPDHCSADFTIRSFSERKRIELVGKFKIICIQMAEMTGTTCEIEPIDRTYEAIQNNQVIESLMAKNFTQIGEVVFPREKDQGIGCTDMGNVSHKMPAIQSYIKVKTGARVHTEEFEEATGNHLGHRAVIAGAKAMAMTTVDLLSDPALMDEVREAFRLMKEMYE